MAITDGTMREIERKAKAGIAMDTPNDAKIKAYNSFAPDNTFYNQPAQTQQNNVTTPQQSFEMYNPSTHGINQDAFNSAIDRSFIQTQGDGSSNYHFGNTTFNQDQMNEVAYYDDMKNKLLKQRHDLTMNEVGKGFGITEEFSKKTLAPLQKQFYEIEDFMLSRFGQFGGRGGTNNDFSLYGLDRQSLGMGRVDENGFRIHDTAQEFETQQSLIQQGYSPQQAYEMVRQIDPNVAYSPTNPFPNNKSLSDLTLKDYMSGNSGVVPQGQPARQAQTTPQTPTNQNTSNEQQSAIRRYLLAQREALR